MIRLKRLYAHDFKQLREIDLHFPDAGRILVQGKNEAGKSTLFEAVFFALFGQALATESAGRPNLEDLIGYEKNKARVELDVALEDRLFRITRTLNRGKANVWELEIVRGDQVENIKGNSPVNKRLVSELGFDAEALLNTCFVEQKKLEKLEGLNKTKREESLSKLLNLERLLDLEERLRLRSDDDKTLSRLSKRADLAAAQEELPAAEQDLNASEGQLKLVELRSKLSTALEEKRAALALRSQLAAMHSRREELKLAVGIVESLDKGRRIMSNALDRFDLLSQQKAALEAMRNERDEAERAARQSLPALEQRVRELTGLASDFERLSQIRAASESGLNEERRLNMLQQGLAEDEQRQVELESTLAQHEARITKIETLKRNYEVGEALGAWASSARALRAAEIDDHDIIAKTQERERSAAYLSVRLRYTALIAFAMVAATAIVPLIIYYLTRNVILVVASGLLLLVLDAGLIAIFTRRAMAMWADTQETAAEIAKSNEESLGRRTGVATHQARLTEAEARLRELGAGIPTSPETAESQRIEIAATLENKTREELSAERDLVLEKQSYGRAQRDEILKRIEERRKAQPGDGLAVTQARLKKATRIVERWQPVLSKRSERLQTAPDIQAIRDARQEAEGQRKGWQARVRQAEKDASRIREAEARVLKLSEDLRTDYETAASLLDGRAQPWNLALRREDYSAVAAQLSEAFETRGGDQVRAQLNSLQKDIGSCETELRLREKAGHDTLVQVISILKELGTESGLDLSAPLDKWVALSVRLEQVNLDVKSELEDRVRRLHMRVGALRETRDRLERELGLQGERVDLASAREELTNERREQEERRYGAEIVSRARKRIVQRILPATMDYMRRILPQLTRDRYHDAELDPETYKIRVWDERAGQNGAWKEKNIFSGGTKDQFSLALRLAFALATLPQERGTSPGFIFLDEPLGSFDDERAAALLFLLTEGEIARAFDQILLISHVRVQEDRFTHQVRLEGGSVVESNLTSPTA